MITVDSLAGRWTLRTDSPGRPEQPAPPELPDALRAGVQVSVPGTVHAQLLAEGLIDDPRLGDNEEAARWVGWTAWELVRTVVVDGAAADHAVLEFDGIDTVAEVLWDEVSLGHVRNFHRRYRFELGDLATPGEHRLVVRFEAPESEALAAQERLGGARPNPYGRPYESLRKMACNFGWDWGPDFPSAGLHRDVRLVRWSGARLGDVAVTSEDLGGGLWRVTTAVDPEGAADSVRVQLSGATAEAAVPAGGGRVSVAVELRDPQLWWPHTHGEPVLHEHRVELLGADGETLDTRDLRTGIRTIELETLEDAGGRSFTFRINGEPVVVRGLNWIPDSCFPGATTRDNLATRFTDAVDAHTNLLRIWGGGTYESEDFYDLADERGLLVWQDFCFACAAYSEDDELAREVEAEARDNVARLQRRASLALWCGNNENIWAYEAWGWPEELAGRTWGERYYFELLPTICAELDPARPYFPGSPWSGDREIFANDDDHGCTHLWDVWNDVDHEHYLDHEPRFVSEFGYQAPPVWSTMVEAIGEDHMTVDDPVLQTHQKAENGHAKLERGLESHGGSSDDIETWWWRAQLLQAQALRLGVTHLRSLAPRCMGAIWWQLNDCWPVISWSVVDSAGRRKPAWYALRSAQADRVVALLGHDVPELRLVNDSPQPWATTVRVEACDVDTGEVTSREIDVELEPRSARRSAVDLAEFCGDRRILRATTADGVRSAAWFPRELAGQVPTPRLDVSAERAGDGWSVTVTAADPVVDLSLAVDRLDPDAVADEQLVTLLPGESHTFTVTGAPDADPASFALPNILWHWGR